MAKVTITFEDQPDGTANVTIDGDPPLEELDDPNNGTMAQAISAWAFAAVAARMEMARKTLEAKAAGK